MHTPETLDYPGILEMYTIFRLLSPLSRSAGQLILAVA